VLDGRELYARASIGIAIGEDRTKDPDVLLRHADTAMYRAKDEGWGYAVFDPVMHEKAIDRLEVENDLGRALEQEEFVIHYQPIVSLQTGEVLAVEALVRWEHPERGLLDPDEFVPMAEESGLVIPMGEQVLREACLRAKEWQEAHPRTPPLVMSVNLSARQLSRPDLADTVERILKETGLEGNCLTLDVTETIYVRALAGNTETLDRLRGPGGEDLHRRLRGRILLAGLPKAPSRRRPQDRQVVREGLGPGRGGHGDRSHDHRVGAHPGFGGHSRRGGDRRAGGPLKGDGLHLSPGLLLRTAAASRGDPGAALVLHPHLKDIRDWYW